VAAFTPFEMTKGRFISQEDVAVNRQYARNVIKSFKENPKVKMIIVADKLRTGFEFLILLLKYFAFFSSKKWFLCDKFRI
jgi:hypothetical protein